MKLFVSPEESEVKMKIIDQAKNLISESALKSMVKEYLLQCARDRGDPWRNKEALKVTIDDIMGLDADLKQYVREYLRDNDKTETSISCDVVSISELIASGAFSPVNAALFIQWYRREPKNAVAFLMQHDTVCKIPERHDDSSTREQV